MVREKRGRKVFSRGIWTAAITVERIHADLETERSTEGFAKKKEPTRKPTERGKPRGKRGFSRRFASRCINMQQWPRRDSNPHSPDGEQDFKSRA
jgi:hypothetical protein